MITASAMKELNPMAVGRCTKFTEKYLRQRSLLNYVGYMGDVVA